MLEQWRPQPISHSQVQEMHVTLGVLMPPWKRKMFVSIHVDPNVLCGFLAKELSRPELTRWK